MKRQHFNIVLVFCMMLSTLLVVNPAIASTVSDELSPCTFPLDPNFNFWNDPVDPSIFDSITFGLDGCAPPDGWECVWDFGDGTTGLPNCFYQFKQYAADGDYTVTVGISDGTNNASLTRDVTVRTHDVAITRLTVPQSARAGQTRQITVYLLNHRYPENVQVELYKSTESGYSSIGTLFNQYVPVRSGNRTTAFSFSYTFTAEDARVGKLTFKAEAFLLDARDAWEADNEIISFPVRVSR